MPLDDDAASEVPDPLPAVDTSTGVPLAADAPVAPPAQAAREAPGNSAPTAGGADQQPTAWWGARFAKSLWTASAPKALKVVLVVLGFAVAAAFGVGKIEAVPEVVANCGRSWFSAPATGPGFTVMVADLTGEGGAAQADRLFDVLGDYPGLTPYRYRCVLTPPRFGAWAKDSDPVTRRGQAWLARKRADVLLWGRVGTDGKTLVLRFLPQGGSGTRLGQYTTSDVEVSAGMLEVLGAQIVAQALATVAPANDSAGDYLVAKLTPVAQRLDAVLRDDRLLAGSSRGDVLHAYALALATIGEQGGEREPLERAVIAFREALAEYTRERAPLRWAQIQHSLGNALSSLGEREAGTARLEEAVRAYRAALAERSREHVPLDWARTLSGLGNTQRALGKRESGTTRLEEAVQALRDASTEYTRAREPLEWAWAQSNLGAALATLGARESSTTRLEEAVQAFRAALSEYTRDRTPRDWAMAQNNLGAALLGIGARDHDPARLEESVEAYRAALMEHTRARAPLDWGHTQSNLGDALSLLGERESGTARLDTAVLAYRAALSELTRERVPLSWAKTQHSLGIALTAIGTRESGTARLKEAVTALRQALDVPDSTANPRVREAIAARLDDAERLIATRRVDAAR